MNAAIDVNNLPEIRRIGLRALREALGPAGAVRFIQQYEKGHGDYTQEKYRQPNLTVEEIDSILTKG
jgi:hypothetical protein